MTPTQKEKLREEFFDKFDDWLVDNGEAWDRKSKDDLWQWFESKLEEVEKETLAHIFKEGNAKSYIGMESIHRRISKKYDELLTDKPNMEKVLTVHLPEDSFDKNGKLKIRKGFDIDEKHLAKSNKLEKPKYGKAMSGSIDGVKAETSPKSIKLNIKELSDGYTVGIESGKEREVFVFPKTDECKTLTLKELNKGIN